MIAKIAVSAVNFAIDKPYSYRIPEDMTVVPGQRVQLPFGRANKRTEGVVLAVESGEESKLKPIDCCLDAEPILTEKEPCAPCFERTCPGGCRNCMKKLQAGEVIEALKQLQIF